MQAVTTPTSGREAVKAQLESHKSSLLVALQELSEQSHMPELQLAATALLAKVNDVRI